jgi:hypothetical protein
MRKIQSVDKLIGSGGLLPCGEHLFLNEESGNLRSGICLV